MSILVNPYRFGSGVLWTPANLGSTLKYWGDPDQQTDFDGATVPALVDRSGNSNNFTTLSGTFAGPKMRYANVNGKKALEFGVGGVQHRLQNGSSGSTLLNGATAATMMIVQNYYADPSTTPVDEAFVQNFTTAGTPIAHFFTDGNIYESFGSSTRRSFNPTPTWAAWRMYCVTSATNDWKAYFDGTVIHSDATNTVSCGTGNRLIGESPSSGAYAKGFVGDVLFCNSALGTTDRQKLEGYLAHKYGLTANLPVGHPYISSPPTV